MRVHPDHTDRFRDAVDFELGAGEPFIDLAARLSPPDPSSIRSRLGHRRAGGLRDRLARQPFPAPAR